MRSVEPLAQQTELTERILAMQASVEKVIKGKREAVRLAIVSLLAHGHLLIEDVPGVGKTTLAHALARSFDCSFQRIQFTSDLLPSDLTGVSIFNQGIQQFEFRRGPLFANVVLADEINRTTPKTQSALLEAMSEGKVTIDDKSYSLPQPFMVIATQNPIEHHGTYPLPESQLDRFLMRIQMGYPQREDEMEILRSNIDFAAAEELTPTISGDEIRAAQRQVEKVRVDESILKYIMRLVEATRNSEYLDLGISPRGSLALYRGSQAKAYLEGRDWCEPEDVKELAVPVFSHRVMVSPRYSSPLRQSDESEGLVRTILDEVRAPG